MTAFKALLETALVGTNRQAPAPALADDDLGHLLHQIQESQLGPQHQLLQMAAVLTACDQAGFRPFAASELGWPAAAAERLPATEPRFADSVLRPILADGPERLQHEAFLRLNSAGMRLAWALLPSALDIGRRSTSIRSALGAVLGERGRWLAARNPAWNFAAGTQAESGLKEQWDMGAPDQRRQALRRMRAHDAAAARELLIAELPQLGAKERAELLALMAPELSAADEPFLDSLLKDRSKEVRQAAATLLVRLPHSRHAQWVCSVLQTLLRQESGLLGKRWVMDAPAEPGPQWKDEAIDAARPAQDSLGERGWWLFQLVRQAPPAWWVQHSGLQAHELLKWSAKTDWAEALQRGWRDAVLAAPDPAWCDALLGSWNAKTLGQDYAAILGLLPLEHCEKYWAQQLSSGGRKVLPQLLALIAGACPPGRTLSASFSRRVAAEIASELGSGSGGDYNLRYQLPEALCCLHPAGLDPLAKLPRPPAEAGSRGDLADRLERMVALRRALATLPTSIDRSTSPESTS